MMERLSISVRASAVTGLALLLSISAPSAQQTPAAEANTWTAAEDHRHMMDQLGISTLRPGPSGNEQAPNHANYDEASANPFPLLPDVLTLKNGEKVTTPEMWSRRRRPEIVEEF